MYVTMTSCRVFTLSSTIKRGVVLSISPRMQSPLGVPRDVLEEPRHVQMSVHSLHHGNLAAVSPDVTLRAGVTAHQGFVTSHCVLKLQLTRDVLTASCPV